MRKSRGRPGGGTFRSCERNKCRRKEKLERINGVMRKLGVWLKGKKQYLLIWWRIEREGGLKKYRRRKERVKRLVIKAKKGPKEN